MSSRKRNEWLDASDEEDSDRGYDSQDESRAKTFRSAKRQKVAHAKGAQSDDSEQEEDTDFDQQASDNEDEQASRSFNFSKDDVESHLPPVSNSLLSIVDLKKKSSKSSRSKTSKSGVIYLSRVPPFMKPQVLRNLLTPYGEIGRIFLTPEDASQRSSRVKSGGSRRKLYHDGWVEFLHKKDAKFVAENLNAQTIGGLKRSRYYDEVWNIRYLKGLKWRHLVEQIANENAERAARMRAEISQSTRENKMFLENIERAKMLEGIEGKKARKNKLLDYGVEDVGAYDIAEMEETKEPWRIFRQNEVKVKAKKNAASKDDNVQRVLSKIF